MNTELKKSIIESMELLQFWIGEAVIIEDWICTSGRHYDRHQTRYGRIKLKIEEFGIRTSGAIATLSSSQQQIEFRTDCIKHIDKKENVLIIEMNIIDSVWRKITINRKRSQAL